MKQNRRLLNEDRILSMLERARTVLIVAHGHPDGDAVGSLLACGRLLSALGKEVTMALPDPVPKKLCFLPGADLVRNPEALLGLRFDLGIALDCADERRMGPCAEAFFACADSMQLDHHEGNPGYASVNEVDPHASSTGCMVWRLMGSLGMRMDRDIAACLYTAISTDTGNFRFSCTDEETFLCAADLAASGFDIGDIARRIHLVEETPHLRLLGRAIVSLRFFCGGKCTSMVLDGQDYLLSGAGPEHCEGIVNAGLNLQGVQMTYLMDLRDPAVIKVSLRAVSPYEVRSIAGRFGGGGHTLAAGCRTSGDPDAVRALIEEDMCRQIEKNR